MTQFKNPTPVAVALIELENEPNTLLGIIRGVAPKIGEPALPGGFVDELETFALAASREVFEETGLNIPAKTWKFFGERITENNRLLVFMSTSVKVAFDDPELRTSNESLGFVKITKDSVLAFPLHEEIAKEWLDK